MLYAGYDIGGTKCAVSLGGGYGRINADTAYDIALNAMAAVKKGDMKL